MRGDISEPLIEELKKILSEGMLRGHVRASAQIPSGLVAKGLTLVLKLDTPRGVTASIFLARPEIPGFLPISVARKLNDFGWTIYNDDYGQQYAVISRSFPSLEISATAGDIAIALETLGAPQKKAWELRPFFE
jgi:hypothetical protein